MSALPKTYDLATVIMSFGAPIVGGYADGDFVKITRDTDTYGDHAGADGEVVRVKSHDRRATIELMLQATSSVNTYLAELAAEDELFNTAVRPFMLKDIISARMVVEAPMTWIKKQPEIQFGKELGTRTWVLRTNDCEIYAGGYLMP